MAPTSWPIQTSATTVSAPAMIRPKRTHSPVSEHPASLEIDRIADQRAGHAVPAAAAAAQFGADDGDDLDPGLAQQGVGAGVAVVGEHHAGGDGDEVVAAVPLLPLVSVGLAAEVDDPQAREVQRGGNHVDEA